MPVPRSPHRTHRIPPLSGLPYNQHKIRDILPQMRYSLPAQTLVRVAQSVEQWIENSRVGGSIPSPDTKNCEEIGHLLTLIVGGLEKVAQSAGA